MAHKEERVMTMPKMIDSEKLISYLTDMKNKYPGPVGGALYVVLQQIEYGTFDPTPPVQPDTEELSQEDIEELSVMFKSMKQSFDSIQGHLNGMNTTLDMFGDLKDPEPPTRGGNRQCLN
ncbi:hypothetical protein KDC22_14380 [Paenibacillus tritici]|uniref:hypothetical protein n=1 Tax=Paenibacillus tritici TaxID=1873425 RepID=UPI001BA47AFD|nr:hypothetical protein [Paenibacillus tritici]QUL57553.1 hypothetical protein KDC22_14380 [Paenibacillus tritici]